MNTRSRRAAAGMAPVASQTTLGEPDMPDQGLVTLPADPELNGGTVQDAEVSGPAGNPERRAAGQAMAEAIVRIKEIADAAKLRQLREFLGDNPETLSRPMLRRLALRGSVASRVMTAALLAASNWVGNTDGTQLSHLSAFAPVILERSQQLSSFTGELLAAEGSLLKTLAAGESGQAQLPLCVEQLELVLGEVQGAAVALAVGASPSFDMHVRDGMCGYALVGVAIALAALEASNILRPSVKNLRIAPQTLLQLECQGRMIYNLGWAHLARWLEHLNPDELEACSEELRSEIVNMPVNLMQRPNYSDQLWAVLLKENVDSLRTLAARLLDNGALSRVYLAELCGQELKKIPGQPSMPAWMIKRFGAGLQLLNAGTVNRLGKIVVGWIEGFSELLNASGAAGRMAEYASNATHNLERIALAEHIVTMLQLASDSASERLTDLIGEMDDRLKQISQPGFMQTALTPNLSFFNAAQEFLESTQELRNAGKDILQWEDQDFSSLFPEQIEAVLGNEEALAALTDAFERKMAHIASGKEKDGDGGSAHKACWMLLAGRIFR